MKILNIVLLIILFASSSFAEIVIKKKVASNECTGMLICQNAEGTGYDNSETWTESLLDGGGSINEDYTTTVLRGTQSILLSSTGYKTATITKTIAASSSVYLHSLVRPTSWPTDTDNVAIYFRDSGNNDILRVKIRADGSAYLLSGGGEGATSTGLLATGSTSHLWVDYIAGSGSNSVARIYIGSTTSKPGTPAYEITGGSATASITQILFTCQWDFAWIIDQILEKSTSFSSVDS